MAEHSSIEWTDATWNPITGCSVVSPGCTNCYAMKLAGGRLQHHPSRAGLTTPSKAGPVWNGQVRFNEDWLTLPLQWKRPRRIFVCAHGDLFHESVPDEWIDKVFAVMALAPHHTFQVLTKRPERMRAYLGEFRPLGAPHHARRIGDIMDAMSGPDSEGWFAPISDGKDGWLEASMPLPNVWLGVSVEDQDRADERIPELLATPAAARFISAEPLLGPIRLQHLMLTPTDWRNALTGRQLRAESAGFRVIDDGPRLDWVIVGGESGPSALPMHPDWARKIRDDCAAARVAFHFKQWGEWTEVDDGLPPGEIRQIKAGSCEAIAMVEACEHPAWITLDGRVYRSPDDLPADTPCRLIERLGKHAAGRVLDGRTHDDMPGGA